MFSLSQLRGDAAEKASVRFLKRQGLAIIETNYRCRYGEIDVIAKDGDHVVFLEVRSRSDQRYGSAAESVDYRKQQRLISAALHYLAHQLRTELPCRFDVIEASANGKGFDINWLKNAFQQ